MVAGSSTVFAGPRDFYLNSCTEADNDHVETLVQRKHNVLNQLYSAKPRKTQKFMALYRERDWLRDLLLIINETHYHMSLVTVQTEVQVGAFVEMLTSIREGRSDILSAQSRFQSEIEAPSSQEDDDLSNFQRYQSRLQEMAQDDDQFIGSISRQQGELTPWADGEMAQIKKNQLSRLKTLQVQNQGMIREDLTVVGSFDVIGDVSVGIWTNVQVDVTISIFDESDLARRIENRIHSITQQIRAQFFGDSEIDEKFERLNMILGKLKMAKKIENLCERIADLDENNDRLNQRVLGLKIRNEVLRDSNRRLRAANIDLHTAHINLFGAFKRAKAKIHDKNQRIKEKNERIDHLETRVTRLKEEVESLRSSGQKVEELKERLERKNQEIQSLKEEVKKVSELEQKLENKKNHIQDLEQRLENKKSQVQDLEQKLEIKKSKIQDLEAEIERLKEKIKELRGR